MYKFAISGKAKTGKNTVGKILYDHFQFKDCQYIAFADPIKKIAKIMFPGIPDDYLTGESELRSEIIPNAFKDGKPLTVRQLLIDIGNEARTYNPDIWVNVFQETFKKCTSSSVIVTDTRFRNEFNFLKKNKFIQIRIYRDDYTKTNDISEIEQDTINDDEFDYIIYNNKSLKELKEEIGKIAII